ncbi:hypothetical protein Tco_1272471 [Tanacetum coccineum]
MTPYTAYPDIQGIIYQDDIDRNRLMRTDELHKFSDSPLNHVRTALNDIATGIKMEYLPKRKWTKQDKQRARVMINAIGKKLRYRRKTQYFSWKFCQGDLLKLNYLITVDPQEFEGYLKMEVKHEEVVASYADLRMEIVGFHDATYKENENTNIALRNYERILPQFKTQNAEGINRVLTNIREVQDAVKEDPTLNKKVLDATKSYTKNSSNLSELLTVVKDFDFLGFKTIIESLQAAITAQNDHLAKWAESSASMAWSVGPRMTRIENTQIDIQYDISSLKTDTAEIKAMMTEIFYAFRGQPFSAPHRDEEKKENPSHTEGEQADMVTEEQKEERVTEEEPKVTQPEPIQTVIPPTSYLKTPITPKGRIIDISAQLEVDGKIIQIPNDQPQEYLNKKERMDRAIKEAQLCDPVIKKVAYFKVLTRSHSEKLKQKASLRKKRFDHRPPDTAYPPVGYDVSNFLPRYNVMHDKSSTNKLFTPLEKPERVFRSKRRLFETPGLVKLNSPEFGLFSDIEERSKEEATEIMTETMKQYMSTTRGDYGSGVTRPKINTDTHFELNGQFLKEHRDNIFSGSEHEDANEHIEKVLEIVDLFHIPNITQDQIML